jgi:choline monooxygenase
MSDIGLKRHLQPASSQLPVGVYHDERIFEAEKRALFDAAPGYVGHRLMVPEQGDYAALDWMGNARALVHGPQGIELLSNVCRHRQAIMLEGRGQTHNIVCPLHRWTYDLEGRLLGAPHFAENPCLHLDKTPLNEWQGLLFSGPRDIAAELKNLQCAPLFDFSNFKLDRVIHHECQYNWKTFIEVYLEDYHVEPFHPGLGGFVSCDDLTWDYGPGYSAQIVGINNALAQPRTPVYKRWHDEVLKYNQGAVPPHGAVWMTLYPNIMLEWYPNVLVVSHLIPRSPQYTTNVVEFYYPEDIVLFEREFIEAQQAAYMETAAEDDEIARRMDAGRRALYDQGLNQTGPYQCPMEDGMQHFHEFIRHAMPHLP